MSRPLFFILCLSDSFDELRFRKVLELGGCIAYHHDDHIVGIEVLGSLGLDVLEGHIVHNILFLGDEVVREIVDPDA